MIPSDSRAVVENINTGKKARRRTQQNQQGGIVSIEMPIHLSKLMLVCGRCDGPTRPQVSYLDDGTKIRKCRNCTEVIE